MAWKIYCRLSIVVEIRKYYFQQQQYNTIYTTSFTVYIGTLLTHMYYITYVIDTIYLYVYLYIINKYIYIYISVVYTTRLHIFIYYIIHNIVHIFRSGNCIVNIFETIVAIIYKAINWKI